MGEIVGGVDLDEALAGEPDGGDFAVGSAGGEPVESRSQPRFVEVRQVRSSSGRNRRERVGLPAAMAEGVLC